MPNVHMVQADEIVDLGEELVVAARRNDEGGHLGAARRTQVPVAGRLGPATIRRGTGSEVLGSVGDGQAKGHGGSSGR